LCPRLVCKRPSQDICRSTRSRDRASQDLPPTKPTRARRSAFVRDRHGLFLQSSVSRSGGAAAPGHSRLSRLSLHTPHSRGLLRPYGAARRGARDRRTAARHYSPARAERSTFPQPRGPRALPVGPALGGGRNGMSQTRRLAAILAADVAGYSRLIGADEGGTLERLRVL